MHCEISCVLLLLSHGVRADIWPNSTTIIEDVVVVEPFTETLFIFTKRCAGYVPGMSGSTRSREVVHSTV